MLFHPLLMLEWINYNFRSSMAFYDISSTFKSMTFLCTAICSIINTGHGDYTILATGREYSTSDSDHGKPITILGAPNVPAIQLAFNSSQSNMPFDTRWGPSAYYQSPSKMAADMSPSLVCLSAVTLCLGLRFQSLSIISSSHNILFVIYQNLHHVGYQFDRRVPPQPVHPNSMDATRFSHKSDNTILCNSGIFDSKLNHRRNVLDDPKILGFIVGYYLACSPRL